MDTEASVCGGDWWRQRRGGRPRPGATNGRSADATTAAQHNPAVPLASAEHPQAVGSQGRRKEKENPSVFGTSIFSSTANKHTAPHSTNRVRRIHRSSEGLAAGTASRRSFRRAAAADNVRCRRAPVPPCSRLAVHHIADGAARYSWRGRCH